MLLGAHVQRAVIVGCLEFSQHVSWRCKGQMLRIPPKAKALTRLAKARRFVGGSARATAFGSGGSEEGLPDLGASGVKWPARWPAACAGVWRHTEMDQRVGYTAIHPKKQNMNKRKGNRMKAKCNDCTSSPAISILRKNRPVPQIFS